MDQIDIADVGFIGRDLDRPECVTVTKKGEIYASDQRGGVARLRGDDAPELILATSGDIPEGFMTNGFSMTPDGGFLIANLADSGGVWKLERDGTLKPFLTEVDGVTLPSINFVNRDDAGRVWLSLSTWLAPRINAMRPGAADGQIILVDDKGARFVADNIGYTNENKTHPSGKWLYANETIGRRVIRWAICDDNSLGPVETVAQFGAGVFPDGFEFDAEGGVWITSVVSNRLIRVAPDGSQHVVIEQSDPVDVAQAEEKFQAGTFERADLELGGRHSLGNIASITFGGPDLKTGYLGSLAGSKVATFTSPIAGAQPPHWNF